MIVYPPILAFYVRGNTLILTEFQVEVNRTLPCTISSIRVLHADHTRRGFLERIFNPLLSVNQDRPYTFAGLLKQVAAEADKLRKFGKSLH